MFSSQNVQAVSETGLTKIASARRQIGAPCSVDCVSWPAFLRLFDGHGGCSADLQWLPERGHLHTPYQHIDAAWEPFSPRAASPQCDPESAPGASRHAFGRRSRPGIAVFSIAQRGLKNHARPQGELIFPKVFIVICQAFPAVVFPTVDQKRRKRGKPDRIVQSGFPLTQEKYRLDQQRLASDRDHENEAIPTLQTLFRPKHVKK